MVGTMKLNSCCPDLERLSHPKEPGLGLIVSINKRGPRFFLMYQNDWQVPFAEAGTQINYCPYCGSKLAEILVGAGENSV